MGRRALTEAELRKRLADLQAKSILTAYEKQKISALRSRLGIARGRSSKIQIIRVRDYIRQRPNEISNFIKP